MARFCSPNRWGFPRDLVTAPRRRQLTHRPLTPAVVSRGEAFNQAGLGGMGQLSGIQASQLSEARGRFPPSSVGRTSVLHAECPA